MSRPFLTARWEDLVFLNYVCPREILDPLVPGGTELDLWRGDAVVSVVGLMFRDTRLLGFPVPRHRTFEEVNLRFYVRRRSADGEPRRAVVFIREVVPRRAIATVARLAYNEPYVAAPMSHRISLDREGGGTAAYGWRYGGSTFEVAAEADGPARPTETESETEFVTEHYWGYTRQRDGGTLEYRVEHPVWEGWTARSASFSGPAAALYGDELAEVLRGEPRSAFVALGSEVTVHRGERLPPEATSS